MDDRPSASRVADGWRPRSSDRRCGDQLAPDVALAIWERVCREATDAYGLRDDERALHRFHQVAAVVAARGGRLPPPTPPGRVPLVGGHGRPRRRLDRVAPAAGGKRLVTEVELLGPHTAKGTIERDAGKGKLNKIIKHADHLAAQRTKIRDAVGLEDESLIVDSQMLISVRKLMDGEPWTRAKDGFGLFSAEQMMVNKLRKRAGLPEITADPPKNRDGRRDLESLIGRQDLRIGNVGLGEVRSDVGVRGMDPSVA